ncbi:MAG: SRPBCC family protein [Mycobacteriaceae bacterium]|nr:SRPBCC family protein [Mycobacteriaceae bacterium]
MAHAPTAQAAIDIHAPAEHVYDIIADVTTLPDWAAETTRCIWLDGAAGPAVGARFKGINQHNARKWYTVCTVTKAERGAEFAFQVKVFGFPSAKWGYRLEPTETGCRVTEYTRRGEPRWIAVWVNRILFGIRDRDEHNQQNIERTLAALKVRAEKAAV